jgi:S1-C subfamily serine protease
MRKIYHRLLMILIAGTAVSSLAVGGRAQTAAPAPTTAVQTPGTTPATAPEKIQPRKPFKRASTQPGTVTVVADQTRVAPQVVTVVHRLSGFKMLRFVMRQSGAPDAVYTIDPDTISSDAHASIIAGWALEDGKTIAVRLPQAGAELELMQAFAMSAPGVPIPGAISAPRFGTPGSGPDLTVITRDGRKLRARYVGLDGLTGLSVLQVNAVVMPASAEEAAREITQGQGVQIFAPERTTTEGETPSRNIFVKVGEVETKISTIARRGGKLEQLTLRGAALSPSVIGGVACDSAGKTLGIVESIEGSDARIVPADTIRAAVHRVLERQTSVPRPLLGVVGEPVEFAKRAAFLAQGWRDDQLTELLQKQTGILLTAVRPGTPAALAKLYPGDVIVRVNQQDVQNGEEFSKLLGEAGSGQQVQFMIRRPSAPTPFPIDVKLGGSFEQTFSYRISLPPMFPRSGGLEWLGVETMSLSPRNLSQLGAENGVLVVAVQPESIAARGGLKEGDVIQSIDGRVVRRGAIGLGQEFNRGKKHVISLVRKREKKQVTLEPVE